MAYLANTVSLPAMIISPTGMVFDARTKQKIGQTKRWDKIPKVDSLDYELRLIIDLFEFPVNTELPIDKELVNILDQSRSIET